MPIKFFAFDLEGTLITQTPIPELGETAHRSPGLWPRIAKALGPAAVKEDHQMYEAFSKGHYPTYEAWCHDSLASFRNHGLNHTLFQRLASSCDLAPGAHSLLSHLHSHNIPTAIITGGFHHQASWAQSKLSIKHVFSAAQLHFASDGSLHSWSLNPSDHHGKVDYLKSLLAQYNLSPKDCAYIGDGSNDKHIASFVGTSFAYNGTPDLKAVTTHAVDHFDQVLPLLQFH